MRLLFRSMTAATWASGAASCTRSSARPGTIRWRPRRDGRPLADRIALTRALGVTLRLEHDFHRAGARRRAQYGDHGLSHVLGCEHQCPVEMLVVRRSEER